MANPHPHCASCTEPTLGRYCHRCGEKRLGDGDRTLKHIVGHGFEAATNANGKSLLTARALLRHPGQLTADYIRGRRKPYLAPLQLFLVANLIFFLLHPLIGSNTLTTSLGTHLHYTWHREIAQSFVEARLAQRRISTDMYAASFDAAAVTQAKSLVILLVPIFAIAVALCYARTRRTLVDHVIFAAHFCTFWLLMICAVLMLTNATIRLLRVVDVFPSADAVNAAIFIGTLMIMVAYLVRATRAVYGQETVWLTVVKAVALALAFDVSLQAYRFVLFFITFWST